MDKGINQISELVDDGVVILQWQSITGPKVTEGRESVGEEAKERFRGCVAEEERTRADTLLDTRKEIFNRRWEE